MTDALIVVQSSLGNYMGKHAALDHTAEELTKRGHACIAAKNLHR